MHMVRYFYAIIIKSKNKGVEINLLPIFINLRYSLTSGRPAILVSRERIPASKGRGNYDFPVHCRENG